jgi:hypothetical protein
MAKKRIVWDSLDDDVWNTEAEAKLADEIYNLNSICDDLGDAIRDEDINIDELISVLQKTKAAQKAVDALSDK